MIVADILHSLNDKAVAEAAVLSIGGDFAATMKGQAARRGMTVGQLTSSLVSAFAIGASERDWRVLVSALAGQDHPVLAGLRVMAERMLHRQAVDVPRAKPAISADSPPAYAAHLPSGFPMTLA